MGMYTELYIAIQLKQGTPASVIEYLKGEREESEAPSRVRSLDELYDSYYFDSQSHKAFKYDEISESWYLTMVFNLKNYGGEIDWLLNYLEPYIETDGHIGHTRYEETLNPTLLFMIDGKIKEFDNDNIK